MSSLEKNLESFKGGNADGNKRDMKAIQGCWKRMKLQTKKEFDAQWRERKKTGGGKAPASPPVFFLSLHCSSNFFLVCSFMRFQHL